MTIAQDPIKTVIWHCFNHYAYADAIFLAERLFAEVGSSEALFLLATAYYRSGKPKTAMLVLDRHEKLNPQCKLLYAQCAWEEKDFTKVEQCLTVETGAGHNPAKGIHHLKGRNYINGIINDIKSEFGDSACFALSLLGRTYQRTERMEHAEKCLLASLKLNPLQWVPFEKLCLAGAKPDPNQVFNASSLTDCPVLRTQFLNFQSVMGTENQQHLQSGQRKKSLSNDADTENNSRDTSNVLRTRQSQNRSSVSKQQPSNPISITPSSVFCMKSGLPTDVGKGQSSVVKPCISHALPHNIVTPPQSRVDFAGILSSTGSLKPLPSSAFSQKDATIPTITSPGNELLRSTPSGDWDSSVDSITSSIVSRSTRTQKRIARGLLTGPTSLSPLTPSFGILPLADTPSPVMDQGISTITPSEKIQHRDVTAPVKKVITRQLRKPHSDQSVVTAVGKLQFTSENTHRSTTGISASTSNQSSTPSSTSMPVRRSTRIFANTGNSIKENSRNGGKSKHNMSKNTAKRSSRSRPSSAKSDDHELSKTDLQASNDKQAVPANQAQFVYQKNLADKLITVLRDIGLGYLALCQYKCKKAISHFNNLLPHQRNTGWVLSALGRAHFELTEYSEAAKVFKDLRILAPHHLKGLEVYSTTLWHMQKDVELSSLAQEMKNLDKLCPETWCTIGDCFSLQHDHAAAASFFRRAIQLDPECSHAYTLLGHEMAQIDDLDGAMACYRNAIRWNPRHYNAWYGIGTIYYKQEKFKFAEIHFRKALSINSNNSVLLCHIGIVQHALKQTTLALQTLDTAVKMEPRNPLCRFHRANVLIAAEMYEDAAQELDSLREMVPKESLVYFLLGKVYKKLHQSHLAVICFSWAMDLDPKGANNQIKEAIDKQHLPDDDDVLSVVDETNDSSMMDQSSTDVNDNVAHGGLYGDGHIPQLGAPRGQHSMDSDSESL